MASLHQIASLRRRRGWGWTPQSALCLRTPRQVWRWVFHGSMHVRCATWVAVVPQQCWHAIRMQVHMYPEYSFCSRLQAAMAAGMRVVVVPSLAKSEYPQPDPAATSGAA